MTAIAIAADASEGIARTNALLAMLSDDSGPIAETNGEVGDVYMAAMIERYSQASDGDGSWAALAASTLAEKRNKGYPDEILVRTGGLIESIVPGGTDNIRIPTVGGTTVGTANHLGEIHQYGTDRMPARPILVDPNAAVKSDMLAKMDEGYKAVLAKA